MVQKNLHRGWVGLPILWVCLGACNKDTTGEEETPRPVVIATDPARGAIGIAPDVLISVTFDRVMAESLGTVTLSTRASVVLSWASSTVLTIDPEGDLPFGERITVVIGKDFVAEANGKSLREDFVLSFTVQPREPACASDTVPPQVTSATSSSVPENVHQTTYELTFSEPVRELTALHLSLSSISGNGTGVISGITAGSSRTTFGITLDFLENGDVYDLAVGTGVTDLCGNALGAEFVARVSVADPCSTDTQAPVVTSATSVTLPAHTTTSTYTLTFNEAVSGVGLASIVLVPHSGTEGGHVTDVLSDGSGSHYSVVLDNLAEAGVYDLVVGPGVIDACGKLLATTTIGVSITNPCGSDSTGPVVTSSASVTLPPWNAVYTYLLTFDEPVAFATASTITLNRTAGTGSGVISSIFADGATVYVNIEGFARGDTYTLTASTLVEDVCGNALAAPFVATLTVPDPCVGDVTPPIVTSELIAKVDISAPRYLLTFSEPVQNVAASLSLTWVAGAGSDTVYTLNALSASVYEIVPRALDWQMGDRFRLRIATGVQDMCTRVTTADVDVFLQVVNCAGDATAPMVVSPAIVTVRPGSANYRLRFSESVVGVTALNLTLSGGDGGGSIGGVATIDPSTYDITLGGLADTYTYNLVVSDLVTDLCDNSLTPTLILVNVSQIAPPVNSEGVIDINTDGFVYEHTAHYTALSPAAVNDTGVACGADGEELVFQYTVQWGGSVVIDTYGTSFDTVLQVFDSDGTTLLGCDDNGSGTQSRLEVPGCASAGDIFYLVVDAKMGWTVGVPLQVNVYETGTALTLDPDDGDTNVARNHAITADFGTPLNPNVGAVTLAGDISTSESYTVGTSTEVIFSAGNTRLTVTPGVDFAEGEVVVVTLSGLEDMCGVEVSESWQFTVRVGATGLVINEIDPGDPDWTEIYNGTASAIDLTGWSLTFEGYTTYYFPAGFVIPSDTHVLIRESSGANTPTLLYTGYNIGWTSSGAISLLDDLGNGVDFMRFGASSAVPPAGTTWTGVTPPTPVYGLSVARDHYGTDTDDGADWESSCGIDADEPTPGSANWSPPTITVTSPNGGESFYQGESQWITWTNTSFSGNVDIRYSANGGGSWSTVVTNLANTGAFEWAVPAVVSAVCVIEVREAGGVGISDISNGYFEILAPSIEVITPNGGETWGQGRTRWISWANNGVSGNVDIRYSTDNGASWTPEATNITNTGSYAWVVPMVASTLCLVEVREAGGGGLSDISDGVFTIAVGGGALLDEDFEGEAVGSVPTGWTVGSQAYTTRQVTDTTAANGTNQSFWLSSGDGSTQCEGISYLFGSAIQPSEVSFWVRASSNTGYSGIVNFGTGCPWTGSAVFFYLTVSGTISINSTEPAAYVANTWYEIRLVMDWTGRTVDFYVDGVLEAAVVPFYDTSVANMTRISFYNYTAGYEAWWDEILIVD